MKERNAYMRCPKCGKDVELQKKQVGVDENGKPIFNEYAICRDCKKQWNLDKQREKKAADANASNHTQSKESPAGVESPADDGTKIAVPKRKTVPADAKNTAPVSKTGGPAKKAPADSRPKAPVKRAAVDEKADAPIKKTPKDVKPDAPIKKTPTNVKPDAPIKKTPTDTKAKAPVKKAPVDGKANPPVKKAPADVRSSAPVKKTPADERKATEGNPSAAPVKKAAPAGKKNPSTRPAPGPKPAPKATPDEKPAPKKKPVPTDTGSNKPVKSSDEQRYSNIPPEKVRVKREKAVRASYEDMLAADPDRKPVKKKRPVPAEDSVSKKKPASSNAAPARKKSAPQPMREVEPEIIEPKAKFRLLRIIFGIISIAAFAFFAYKGFLAGLDNISAGTKATTGTIYIVLALCMLVSGLLLLIMQKKRTILAFVLPMLFYIGSAVFAFLKRGEDNFLLYGAIAGAALAVIFLILTIASRGGDEEDDFDDDYDDPFEDDYDN